MSMSLKPFLTAGVIASATLLSGCYEGGYGAVGLNVGAGGPYDYYEGYGAPYGAPYYGYGGGWYGDFYYPGGGYYVYNRYGQRSRWDDRQRAYWNEHRGQGRWDGGNAAPAPTQRGWFYGGGGRRGGQVVAPPTGAAPQAQQGQAYRGQEFRGNPDRGGRGGRGGGDRPARGMGGRQADPNGGREQPK